MGLTHRADKPNSVPVLPTAGGAKPSILSFAKDMPLVALGTLDFVITCGEQNRRRSFIWVPPHGGTRAAFTSSARRRWRKTEYPELVEGPLDFARDAQFCIRLRRTKLAHSLAPGYAFCRFTSGSLRNSSRSLGSHRISPPASLLAALIPASAGCAGVTRYLSDSARRRWCRIETS